MIHVVLVSFRQEESDLCLPHWETVLSTDDESQALRRWLREVKSQRAYRVLWVGVTAQQLTCLKGYVSFPSDDDVLLGLALPVAVLAAWDAIQTAAGLHRGLQVEGGFGAA